MARLQILELPEGAGDDRPPFILVIDECAPQRYVIGVDSTWQDHWQRLADKIGARGVIVTPDTIDIPANDTSAYALGVSESAWTQADRIKARATEAVRAVHERTDIARGMDRLANHKAAITDALGLDRLRDWDDIRNAAAGIKRDREAKAEAVDNVRHLHRAVEHRDQIICWGCSYPIGATSESPLVAHDQCETLRALNQKRNETSPTRG